MAWSRALIFGLSVLVTLFHSGIVYGAPKAELWDYWRAFDAASSQHLDHSFWARDLAGFVHHPKDGIARLDYQALLKSPAKEKLEDYIKALSAVRPRELNRDEQKVFWINLYNALTIKVVLDHYPIASIRDVDISPGMFSDGPWGAKLITIDTQPLSLDDIEHRILRPIWNDPRLHFALNCASLGCPDLNDRGFHVETLEASLDQAASRFINHPRGVTIEGTTLQVSSLFIWYRQDFGETDKAIIGFLLKYAEPSLQKQLISHRKIDSDAYDWGLNQ